MAPTHGMPCWYELSTTDPDAAGAFYAKVLGWTVADAGLEGVDYRLASHGGDMVAGIAPLEGQDGPPQPGWLIYFTVDDSDAAAAAAAERGASILQPPGNIPGTGRYAVLADPQGAVFGILAPLPMEGEQGSAFDQQKEGHAHWNELMSSDPVAGMAFYGELFGWQKTAAMDMGEMGSYQLFAHGGRDIGAAMPLGNAPMPVWLPYFGVAGVSEAIRRVEQGGGTIIHGPQEVPGGAWIAVARDPQGGHFAVVGPHGAEAAGA